MVKAEGNWAEFTKQSSKRVKWNCSMKCSFLAFLQSFNQHSESYGVPLPLFQIFSSQQLCSHQGDRKLSSTINKRKGGEEIKNTKLWNLSNLIHPIWVQISLIFFLFLPCREYCLRTEHFLLKTKPNQGVYLCIWCSIFYLFLSSFLKSKIRSTQLIS